jgi:transposase
MSKQLLIPPKSLLENEYVKSGTTLSSLAKLYNTSRPTIKHWLQRYDISLKTHLTASTETNKKFIGNRRLPKEVVDKLDNHNWVYNQRITERKSADTIASELGISTISVYKAFKHHSIPIVKYNESDYVILNQLNNKTNLETLYSSGLTYEKIAKQLGSTKSTVQRFMIKHGIEPRPSNSYEREITKRSSKEKEISSYIESLGETVKICNKINGVEIDILIPDKKLAFEFNGLWYHSDKGPNKIEKYYHLNKTKICENSGIRLIHIWEDEWRDKQEILKSTIKNLLGKTSKKIYGRNCIIKHLEHKQSSKFLDNNHIQGYTKSSIHLGLFFNDKLVAVMTFGKSRFNKNASWELIRYATSLDTNVLGGFSKLLSYFQKYYSGSIITYADRSYSQGNVYLKNGFTLIKTNKPSYHYIVNHFYKRVNRTIFTKSKFKEFDKTTSEKNITDILALPKIWDCGTYTFIKQ